MMIDMRDHVHKPTPDDGKYIIINTHKKVNQLT